MRDPFFWSIPLGRWFGVAVRVHVLFPFVAAGMILHAALQKPPHPDLRIPDGTAMDVAIMTGLLFVIVLLHEFGHCFGARWVEGDAQEILMWPLGGLAFVEVPHTPRANFIATAAGPAVNVLICAACLLLLLVHPSAPQPPWNPLPGGFPFRDLAGEVTLSTWGGGAVRLSPYSLPVFLARAFWLSYFLFLLNVLLVGFPLDGGRLLQAVLWRYAGYRQATLFAVFAGFLVVFVVGLYAIVADSVLAVCLAIFIYVSCRNQWIILETGGEEGAFGYDFSQGYTSLERDQPPAAPARRVSWWQRWLQRRAARRMQREQETREAEERRMDELLEKVQRQGISALTDEERRFMKRVSDRYRNRQ
jgi:Zn-dependent protease